MAGLNLSVWLLLVKEGALYPECREENMLAVEVVAELVVSLSVSLPYIKGKVFLYR